MADVFGTEGDDPHLEGVGSVHDSVFGLGGNDRLFGQLSFPVSVGPGIGGPDTLVGGPGDDEYHPFYSIIFGTTFATETIIENAGEGSADSVVIAFLPVPVYVLPANVENLFILGAGRFGPPPVDSFSNDLHGNSLDNLIVGAAGAERVLGGGGNDLLFGGRGADRLEGDGGDDRLFGEQGADLLIGGLGQDVLSGGDGDDTLGGGAGNDTLVADGGADLLLGEDGDDLLVAGAGNDAMGGGSGDDVLGGGDGDDLLEGADGSDHLFGEAGDDRLLGGAGGDTLSGGQGQDLLAGGDDADDLFGEDGDDHLFGDAGNDRLNGGAGTDDLLGGAGDDSFVFLRGSGHDRIFDFQAGAGSEDRIVFVGLFGSFAQVQAAARQSGGNTEITLDADHSITLVGVQPAALAADDFVFS
jgi:Ca2+-binding RTX toxin-like protein